MIKGWRLILILIFVQVVIKHNIYKVRRGSEMSTYIAIRAGLSQSLGGFKRVAL